MEYKTKAGVVKKTFTDKAKLSEIMEVYPTPFHLYDERGIRNRARLVKQAFAWNPGFREFFAVKATPNPAILRIMKEEGCGADCSSYTELLLSKAVGITGQDIMYSSNMTPARDYRFATGLGAIINLDDITHIDFLNGICGIPKTICCRYNPGGVFRASTHVMDNPGDAKFGFTKEQLFEGFNKLKRLGANRFGVHAFLASATIGNDYYPELARVLFKLAIELSRETGVDIRFINLSGGIGLAYRPDDPAPDMLKIGDDVRKVYNDTLVAAGMGDVALYTELGRFMLGDSGALITTVIHEKHIYKDYIGVDACAANLMRPAMYKAYHHITVMGKEGDTATTSTADGDANTDTTGADADTNATTAAAVNTTAADTTGADADATTAAAANTTAAANTAADADVTTAAAANTAATTGADAGATATDTAMHMYDVAGSLCENNDKFAVDRMLPLTEIGDILWIHDTGAHGHSMGYNYNGSLRSAEILLRENGDFKLIRRAETPKDYFATLVDPDVLQAVEADARQAGDGNRPQAQDAVTMQAGDAQQAGDSRQAGDGNRQQAPDADNLHKAAGLP